MRSIFQVVTFDPSRMKRCSRVVRRMALGLILLLMLAVFADFYRTGMIYARGSLFPFYLFFLAAIYAVCIFVECLSIWCVHEHGFYCARTIVHTAASMIVVSVMGAFFAAGGAARVGVTLQSQPVAEPELGAVTANQLDENRALFRCLILLADFRTSMASLHKL